VERAESAFEWCEDSCLQLSRHKRSRHWFLCTYWTLGFGNDIESHYSVVLSYSRRATAAWQRIEQTLHRVNLQHFRFVTSSGKSQTSHHLKVAFTFRERYLTFDTMHPTLTEAPDAFASSAEEVFAWYLTTRFDHGYDCKSVCHHYCRPRHFIMTNFMFQTCHWQMISASRLAVPVPTGSTGVGNLQIGVPTGLSAPREAL
jgi:hypothetical protein